MEGDISGTGPGSKGALATANRIFGSGDQYAGYGGARMTREQQNSFE